MIKFTINKTDTRTEKVIFELESNTFEIASVDKQDFNNRMQRLIDSMNELINEFNLEKVSK